MDEKDPRLIMTLEAVSPTGERAWNRPQNQDRCLPASESVADISSRESTPAVGQPKSQIQLTFDNKPKDLEKGFVFGSDPRICDVFLGERGAGFSGQQFYITFNEREVIFKNTSRKEAQVDYNGEDPPFRNQFTWILFDTYENRDSSNHFVFVGWPPLPVCGSVGEVPPSSVEYDIQLRTSLHRELVGFLKQAAASFIEHNCFRPGHDAGFVEFEAAMASQGPNVLLLRELRAVLK